MYNRLAGSDVLRIRVRDLDPWIRDPGWVKNQDPDGSGMNIPDHISKSLEQIFGVKNT
jgi:hypothetical protein